MKDSNKPFYTAKLTLKDGKVYSADYDRHGLKLVGSVQMPSSIGAFKRWAQTQDFEKIEVINV